MAKTAVEFVHDKKIGLLIGLKVKSEYIKLVYGDHGFPVKAIRTGKRTKEGDEVYKLILKAINDFKEVI